MGKKDCEEKLKQMFEKNSILINQLEQAKKLLKNWMKEFNCKLSFNERAELVENTEAFLKE